MKDEFYDKCCNYFNDFNRDDHSLSSYTCKSDFNDIFLNAVENMKSCFKQYSSTQSDWWDHDCKTAKDE